MDGSRTTKPFTLATDSRVYFCSLGSPWQRGTNEHTNRLLRQYFPRGRLRVLPVLVSLPVTLTSIVKGSAARRASRYVYCRVRQSGRFPNGQARLDPPPQERAGQLAPIDNLASPQATDIAVSRLAEHTLGPEMLLKLFFSTPCLNEEASIDGFVRHVQALLIRIRPFEPAVDLLWRPIECELAAHYIIYLSFRFSAPPFPKVKFAILKEVEVVLHGTVNLPQPFI
jgi:hypothetical protein